MADRTNLEIEMKCYISEEKYHFLLEHFNIKDKVNLQTNYYFDTLDHSLQRNKTVLRIRQKGNQYKLTSKAPQSVGVLETHKYLTEDEALDMIKSGFDAGVIGINQDVRLITKLDTYRVSLPYLSGKLFIDKSIYGDKIDYEIEYEVSDEQEGKNDFMKIIDEFELELTSTKSKAKRAFEEAKKNEQ